MIDRPVALITGAGGFVGRHLIAELTRETNWAVVGIDRTPSKTADGVLIRACDLRQREIVERIIDRHKPQIIFHLAAQTYVPKALGAPSDTITNNITGQLNLFEACRLAGADPFIIVVGSAEEYGLVNRDELPVTEDQPFRPSNPYAVSKIAQDMLGYQYYATYGMRIVRFRPFNHFGPGQSDRFVISSFARQVAEAEAGIIEPTVLTGNINVERDFLDVRDVVKAYRIAVDQVDAGEVYNLASGVAHRIGDLLAYLLSTASIQIATRLDAARIRPVDIPILVGDAAKFRNATMWEPTFSIESSLDDTLEYWRGAVQPPG